MVDAAWFNASAGAPEYDAQELRRLDAAVLAPGVPDRFGARAGVRPGGSAAVTLAGTTVTVDNLNAVMYPGLSSLSGPYRVQIPSVTHELNPAGGSNPRKDIVVLQIQDDDEDSSGQRRALTVYKPGTAAASPTEPAVLAGEMKLATIDVPVSGGGSATLTYNAPYYATLGGVLPVRTTAERPVASLYPGYPVWRQDTNTLEMWTGVAWSPIADPTTYGNAKLQACKVGRTTTQTIANDTNVAVTFSVEGLDNSGMFAVTSDTITITEKAGLYYANGCTEFAANLTGYRRLMIVHNGSVIAYNSTAIPAVITVGLTVAAPIVCGIGDTIQMWVRQNSGGNLVINPGFTHFSVARQAVA